VWTDFGGALTPPISETFGAFCEKTSPVANFDGVVLSFQAGHRKPAPEIFALAVEQSGIAAEHSVFVDDQAKNCDRARAAGWRAIHFTSAAAAIDALD
jgi:putative hydrolase of the HAD superfamily